MRRPVARHSPRPNPHIAAGSEDGKTNIVAGKVSIFKSVNVLEWVKTITGTYKSKKQGKQCNAFSRCLVAEWVFAHPWCGRSRLRVACVHVHYKAAKTDPKTAVTDTKCHAHSFCAPHRRSHRFPASS